MPQNEYAPCVERTFEFSFWCESRQADAKASFENLSKRYPVIGFGNYRVVFKLRGPHVLKFPLSEAGEFCNDGEGSVRDLIFASGRYVEINGLVCVVQEFVEDASLCEIRKRLGRLPDWVAAIDCGQVGFNKKGELKAYDFVHP